MQAKESTRKSRRFFCCIAVQPGDKTTGGRGRRTPNVPSPPAPGPLMRSAAVTQAVAQEVLQLGHRVYFTHRRVDVVLHPPVPDRFVVQEHVAGAPVAVARLANRAYVAQGLALVQLVGEVDLLGAAELVEVVGRLLREDTGYVRVTLEAVALDQREDALHLPLVVNVFG